MLVVHAVAALWLTELLWFGWQMRELALAPLWRRLGLDGEDME